MKWEGKDKQEHLIPWAELGSRVRGVWNLDLDFGLDFFLSLTS